MFYFSVPVCWKVLCQPEKETGYRGVVWGKSSPRPSVAVKIDSEKFVAQVVAEKFLARRRRKRFTEEQVSL